MVKNLPAMKETRVLSLGTEDPWRRKCQLTLVFLPGKSHRQRSLAGYSPWGHKSRIRLSAQSHGNWGEGLCYVTMYVTLKVSVLSACEVD